MPPGKHARRPSDNEKPNSESGSQNELKEAPGPTEEWYKQISEDLEKPPATEA